MIWILLACNKNNEATRAEMIAEIEQYRSAWDRRHLTGSVEEATTDCSDTDINYLREMVRCYSFFDLPELCPNGEEPCYGEPEPECSRIEKISEACVDSYFSFYADDEPVERDCGQASTGASLVQATSARDQLESALPSGFTLMSTFEAEGEFAYLATSQADGGTLCHVVYKGLGDADAAVQYARVMSAVDCIGATGQSLGICDRSTLGIYHALNAQGLYEGVRGAIDTGECSAGIRIYGHNLGGAMASLLAAELVTVDAATFSSGYLELITFGEPQVFDTSTAAVYDASVPKTRWVTWADPVTQGGLGGHFGVPVELFYPFSKEHPSYMTAFTEVDHSFVPWGEDLNQHSLTDKYLPKLAVCQ